jgi:hypothetical protein
LFVLAILTTCTATQEDAQSLQNYSYRLLVAGTVHAKAATMAPLASLTNDAWIEILSQLSSLKDLRSAVLSSRRILNAFYERRTALISTVLRAEIIASYQDFPYEHARAVVRRLRHKPLDDKIVILEAIAPLLKESRSDERHYKWCEQLCWLYNYHILGSGQTPPSLVERRHAFLQRAHQDMLESFNPIFELTTEDADQENPEGLRRLGSHNMRLPRSCYFLAGELAKDYASLGQIRDKLRIEQEILTRAPFAEDDLRWGDRVIETLRALQDDRQHTSIEDTVQFENRMYELCRRNREEHRSLFWARHLVGEYTRAGRTQDAIMEQRRILLHLRAGRREFVTWARQLVVMHMRAGRVGEALEIKAAVWDTMTVNDSCYFGWACELADLYRQNHRREDALRVVLRRQSQAQQAMKLRKWDSKMCHHATLATLALISEYEYGHRLSDAAAVRKQFFNIA